VPAPRLHRVAVLVLEGAKPLDVGIPAQVFTTRASMPYEVRVCGPAPGLVTGGDGLSYFVADGLDALAWADIVFIPGYRFPDRDDPPPAVVDALIAAHDRGVRLAAISTGAFALAATGLLDGKRATTHWHYTRALRAKHPLIRVDENVLFVDEGGVLTSAGAASGIDLCLHILRSDLGVAASNHAARRLVAAPFRAGGQAQYVPRSVPELLGERFAATREWALGRLDKPLTLDVLARHASVSPRTFSRRFLEDSGYTPMEWVLRSRIDAARELLELSARGVEQIAADVGLGTGANLRRHFHHAERVPPDVHQGRLSAWRDPCGPWRSRRWSTSGPVASLEA
jgi:transcriptional regulator GlxA family with amidase domain